MKRLALIVTLAALVAAVVATPGSTASFNDSAPCPADGPLLVCPTMTVGQPVQLQLLAHDGCDAYRWEIVIGGLPARLSMSSSGLITGTPTTAGTPQPRGWGDDPPPTESGPPWGAGGTPTQRHGSVSPTPGE